uniref:Molybdate-anion transporter-like n=1 Tax=Rhizophora mucronata TaxID=61149 RepID=A0A2P2QLS5_RHIMU
MAVEMESASVWEPNPSIYIFIMICSLFSIILLPRLFKNNRSSTPSVSPSSPFDQSFSSPSSLRFRRNFLCSYCLASVMEGMWSVFGELELAHYGLAKEQIVTCLCVGYGTALIFSAFLGMLSDLIGHKKACLIFCTLHLFVGIWKRIASRTSIWIASICLPLATSIFSFSFEAWVVVENEKQGHRQDALNDMFWLMTFIESATLIGSQVLSNWLVGNNLENGIASSSTATIILAMIGFILVSEGWKGSPQTAAAKEHKVSYAHILRDKRIWLLALAHGSLQFSIAVFWILWAPTLVVRSHVYRHILFNALCRFLVCH